ncbi:hypothetical protein [Catellatospora tritici]|uniref:hypothetical protein n=1 Tax=Catellatospora tritici TaxID=2851566 RepID=UPI001C2DA482|nr:hypothetical protein [Catellatospora tritici]MBV1848717.1 hypothetical protein [Catellatospora tritici]
MRKRLAGLLAAVLWAVVCTPSAAYAAVPLDLALSDVPSAVTTGAHVTTAVEITVRNQGSATAQAYLAVSLEGDTGRIYAGSTGNPIQLEPGEQGRLTAMITLRAYAKTGFAGTMVVQAQGSVGGSVRHDARFGTARVKVTVGVPRISDVVVSGNKVALANPGETAVFRYTVTNRGPMEEEIFELTVRNTGFEIVKLVGCTKLAKSSFRCRTTQLAPGRSLHWEMHLRFAKTNVSASGGMSVLVAERSDDTNMTNSFFGFDVRARGTGAVTSTRPAAVSASSPSPTTAAPSPSVTVEASATSAPPVATRSEAAAGEPTNAGEPEPGSGSPAIVVFALVLTLVLGASIGLWWRGRRPATEAAEPAE